MRYYCAYALKEKKNFFKIKLLLLSCNFIETGIQV